MLKKKLVSAILVIALAMTLVPFASPAALAAGGDTAPQFIPAGVQTDESLAQTAADKLYALGLFQGVGDNADGTPDFALDRAPTRHEAVTMLVRLLGKESDARNGTWETPFTDVADWAKPYVGYAYENKLTYGISATEFGGYNLTTPAQYAAFVMRALGYNSETDFQFSWVWRLSDELRITNGEYDNESRDFTRGDIAIMSVNGLLAPYKEQGKALFELLIENGAITPEAASGANLINPEIAMYLDGELLTGIDGPQVVHGQLFLPLSGLLESLSYEVEWSDDGTTAEINVGDHLVRVQVGSDTVSIKYPYSGFYDDHEWHEDDGSGYPLMVQNDRIYVINRFVTDYLNCNMKWIIAANRVEINRPFIFRDGAWYISGNMYWPPSSMNNPRLEDYQMINTDGEPVWGTVWAAGDLIFVNKNSGEGPIMSSRHLYMLNNKGYFRLIYSTRDLIPSVKVYGDSCYVMGEFWHWRLGNSFARVLLDDPYTQTALGSAGYSYGMFITGSEDGYINLSSSSYDDLDFEIRDEGIYTIGFDASVVIEGFIGKENYERLRETYGYYLIPLDGSSHQFIERVELNIE